MLAFSYEMFAHADEYRGVFQVMVGQQSGAAVQRALHKLLVDLIRDDMIAAVPRTDNQAIPREALVQFIAGALFGLLMWWLEEKKPLSAHVIRHGATRSTRACPFGSWRRCRGAGRRLAIDCVRLHQLDSGPVGIEQIDLAPAIDSNLNRNLLVVEAAGRPSLELLNGLLRIRHHQADVILRTPLQGRRELAVKHEFNVVVAVGHAHIYPAQGLARACAAAPELSEPENAMIEIERFVEIADKKSGVHHVSGNARGGHPFARLPAGPAIGLIFDDFYRVIVRIFDIEVLVAG